MRNATGIALLLLIPAALASPAAAQTAAPDLTGDWVCDPSAMLIRDEWTTLTYTFTVSEQRDALFKAEMHWSLPPEAKAEGNQGGEDSYSGTIKVLGVIDFDNLGIEMVAYGDGHRHSGRIVHPDTIEFVHSETGDNAWVSRSTCRRSK